MALTSTDADPAGSLHHPETQGRLENLNVAMVGDLKYGRTVHSLTQALAKFNGNRFYFIAPDALAMPQYILDMLDESCLERAQRH